MGSTAGIRLRPAAIQADGWGWRHGGRTSKAVSGLELRIEPGERVLLLGASGAGKSTLLHALAGVLGADEEADEFGSLLIDGVPARALRGRAGLMQQDPETQVILSRVGDDVAFGAENLAVEPDEIWSRVADSLDAVGLDLPLDHPTSHLSGGQKQRLALAGILAMRPGLILLDEPTANLDPGGVLEVRDAVARVVADSGATLVVVEHRVEIWADIVDRVVVLEPGGGVMADGAPDVVLTGARQRLIEAGVWVPAHVPALPGRRGPGSGEPLLAAQALAVSRHPRGRRRQPPPAVVGVDAVLGAGRALNVTGPNGSGKSALALTMAGLLPAVAGRVQASAALAHGLAADPLRWKARELISRIGTVFQEPEHQFVTAGVADELAFGPRQLGVGGRETRAVVDELMGRLRLDGLAQANPFTLSGGEKRRLSVATVLASRPAVLILDEPTFGQDAGTWAELAALLHEFLDDGGAVLSVSHDEAFVQALGGTQLRLGGPDQ